MMVPDVIQNGITTVMSWIGHQKYKHQKIDNLDFIKIKNFCASRGTIE